MVRGRGTGEYMNNRKRYALAAVIATVAGFVYLTAPHRSVLSDFRDAPAEPAIDTLKDINPAGVIGDAATPAAPVSKGYAAEGGPSEWTPSKPVEWVSIPGGKFTMGTDSEAPGFEDAKPAHEVMIKNFDMARTLVTVEQYAECVHKGRCTEPGSGNHCNWGKQDKQHHPVNCVSWKQADKYAKFMAKQPGFEGARLPSESEWEYAARSAGRDHKYPWGNEEPTCDKVVLWRCGNEGTMPVCGKPAGNTLQGLCDMAGNVHWQWVQDMHRKSYKDAPVDGSAFEGWGSVRVLRGGAFASSAPGDLQTGIRFSLISSLRVGAVGFRLAR
ncbi:MAG TPA: hypothetical protein DEF68_05850 [Elusimicrobia bacterium]|nr:hypothetical protein [Elusimicrobiota bacterium]HBW22886.1 hypothetical protein [Elusimicrobiota bacterium]